MKIAMVDVDNILHEFDYPLYDQLKVLVPEIPPPTEWTHWAIFDEYMDDDTFYKAVDSLHERQHEMKPFKHAKPLLDLLAKKGYYITICSNRKKKFYDSLKQFLDINGLKYNNIIVSNDKNKLIKKGSVNLIIDDSPKVLTRAAQVGCFAVGLEYTYNKNRGYLLFKDIPKMITYLKEVL